MDPLTILVVGAGALVFREMNRKDYGVLTPSRDERYRNAMEYCHRPEELLEEAKLFNEYGLKAQGAMLKRRAEWRARPPELKKTHEEIYQKALNSENTPAILEVASAFEGWTATKKAATLREHVRVLQEGLLEEVARRATEAAEASEAAIAAKASDTRSRVSQRQKQQTTSTTSNNGKGGNGAGIPSEPFIGVTDTSLTSEDSSESET